MGNVLTFLLPLPKSILHMGNQEEDRLDFFRRVYFVLRTYRGGDNRRGGILCAGNPGAWKKGGKPEGRGEEKTWESMHARVPAKKIKGKGTSAVVRTCVTGQMEKQ